ncbi:DUF305 domain-containing protein [Acrocarpospora catenulata]|uniref:DUF305 domain-containing protein n=1 Tax=Acrocarpospora catenulata TaxID=2836182 RepID=UPI001BDB311B|nr:DUF305 domain-containing protein [Acrocarpospora catenulata]
MSLRTTLLTLSFLATACAAPAPPGAATPSTVATAAALNADLSVGTLNATDIAWAQLMVPMSEGLLTLLDWAPDRVTDPDLARLAAQVGAAHRDELPALQEILTRAGVAHLNPHEGHDMPGMVTKADLTLIKPIKGRPFERLLITHLRDHLKQVLLLANSETKAGTDPATHTLAAAIAQTRTAELSALNRLAPS